MSVAGIDFGNLSLLIGQTSKGGVDVILNDASNRQTATAVSIDGKQRHIGDSGAAMARSNMKNTITGMKLLVGRQFDDPDVQEELKNYNFNAVKLDNGGVGINVMYNGEDKVVPVEHFMAMMLVKAKQISFGANNGVNLADSVLAVPNWFTESQRRGVLYSCQIADVNCLKVAHESALIALSYGIFKSAKKLFSETEPCHMMFVDIGYTGYTVTIVDFIQENMKVLATVCDRYIGGRYFDKEIVEFLAEEFEKKTKINVRNNKKALLKLYAAAEKAKKTLSPAGVNEAVVNVECLAEDIDLSAKLTRDEFESRIASIIGRLQAPIDQALTEAGLTKEQIHECEILGGSTRINIVKKTLGEILGLDANAMNYGLKTTMNADEAVARGGALQCAMVSSRLKVKPFNIIDRLYYGVIATYADDEDASKSKSAALYTRGDELPHKARRLVFKNKRADFDITLSYDEKSSENLPAGESKFLGKYKIKYPATLTAGLDVRVTFGLDKNNISYLVSAEAMEEVPAEESKEAKEEKEGEAKEDAKTEEKKDEGKETEIKKKFKKVALEFEVQLPGLSEKAVKDSIELEASMFFEDKLITETADRRNDLESYIYAIRDRLVGDLKEYGKPEEIKTFSEKVDVAENWLYDEGYDVTKQEYVRKLDDLKSSGQSIMTRFEEAKGRDTAIENLKKQIEMCKSFTSKYDESTEHITEEERDKIRNEVKNVEAWMYDMMGKQGDLKKSDDVVLTCASINTKRQGIHTLAHPIMRKPKPAPAPKKEEKPEEKKDQEKTSNADEKKGDKDEGKMDVDGEKSEGNDKNEEKGENKA